MKELPKKIELLLSFDSRTIEGKHSVVVTITFGDLGIKVPPPGVHWALLLERRLKDTPLQRS